MKFTSQDVPPLMIGVGTALLYSKLGFLGGVGIGIVAMAIRLTIQDALRILLNNSKT